jgi:hypothetical protein
VMHKPLLGDVGWSADGPLSMKCRPRQGGSGSEVRGLRCKALT